MTTTQVVTERMGHVLHIRINRPEVRNALAPRTYHELSLALDELENDPELWVGVLTGSGEMAFSAGRDLKQLASMAQAGPAEKAEEARLWQETRRLTDRFDFAKPLIARLNGSAHGGGLELALACDIIVAADHAQLALPEPRRGLIATAGGVHRLPRQIGLKAAMGYLLTGRAMSAQRGFELGLINQVVPLDELDAAVTSWVDDILACAPLAVRSTKACAMQGLDHPLREAMTRPYEAETLRQQSQDSLEGPKAFAEKRSPRWLGC
ncbi:enoyl-CoA hydratase [Stutzerimonas frequens]|uniref:enoyl-CoA hydratase-related protein n=1 Tax=Stutzerimonas frequens TaxID=2968969 RepID=UPI000D7D69BD|nr:enoyl-CoA hydratase-related protein [Stutzerimonas frequens]AWT12753.1 enoyl-CoA hydratase [Stutzerimonas frequens]